MSDQKKETKKSPMTPQEGLGFLEKARFALRGMGFTDEQIGKMKIAEIRQFLNDSKPIVDSQ